MKKIICDRCERDVTNSRHYAPRVDPMNLTPAYEFDFCEGCFNTFLEYMVDPSLFKEQPTKESFKVGDINVSRGDTEYYNNNDWTSYKFSPPMRWEIFKDD